MIELEMSFLINIKSLVYCKDQGQDEQLRMTHGFTDIFDYY